MELHTRDCIPCRGDTPPLTAEEREGFHQSLDQGWKIVDGHHLERNFRLPNFQSALDLVNQVGAIAEEQDHHPDLELGWGRVGVKIWTHAIDGLTESDFVLAAKIDQVPVPAPKE